MLIYWLFFAFPALLALSYPSHAEGALGFRQRLALATFVLSYVVLAGLRFETGGDWQTYQMLYDDISVDSFTYSLGATDPLYGALNWLSAQLGAGVFLVNAICAAVLGYGTVAVSIRLRDPWLGILMAVPYLLIVVGMGYVRQGASIGMILIAIANFDRSRPMRAILCLIGAVAFHSTALVTFPIFAYAVSSRYRRSAVVVAVLAGVAFTYVLAPRLDNFELGYIEQEYDSGGALTRLLLSFLLSALVLLRWRHFAQGSRMRSIFLSVAVANFMAMAALQLTPSSTAVDRIGLFFSIIQIAALAEIRSMLPLGYRAAPLIRIFAIGLAAIVQVVWLVYATHSIYWVPYASIFDPSGPAG